jgi:plasmid stability protein
VTSLLISDVDEALHTRLKASAAAHRRSLEEEARELLSLAVARRDALPQESPAVIAQRIFGPLGGVDLQIPPRGEGPEREPPDFSHPDFDPKPRPTS